MQNIPEKPDLQRRNILKKVDVGQEKAMTGKSCRFIGVHYLLISTNLN